MTDIVERLRDISPGPSAELDMLGREAADEIERLRAALREIIADSFSVYAILLAREALEEGRTEAQRISTGGDE